MPQLASEIMRCLIHYRNPQLTKRDITQAITICNGLAPKVDSFVFNNGDVKELVCLDGTIPVNYKGATYNIPVCVWISENHPSDSPLCFVKPTSDMQIMVSEHVDQTGKISLPYLREWKRDTSDLIGLIQIMLIIFGDQPPVYAKPRSRNSNGHNRPAHATSVGGFPLPNIDASTTRQYQYPAYPVSSAMTAQQSVRGYNYPGIQTTNYASGIGSIHYPSTTLPYPSYTGANNMPYPTASPYANYSSQPTSLPLSSDVTNTNTISEAHIKASVLSAVEDKIKRRLNDVVAQAEAEMEVLKRTGDELTRGKGHLETIINKLENEQVELEKNIGTLRERNGAIINVIDKLEKHESLDVDEAVVTTTPLYRQLLNLFAEENATEDAIYYLGEALRKGIIDLDLFLKHIRELSRKQFMLRQLMQKCRRKANLPCS